MDTRNCKECGKPFIPSGPRQQYCKGDHFRCCPICGKPYLVKNCGDTELRACSSECIAEKKKRTLMNRYGVTNANNIPGVSDRRKKTNIEKYGTANGRVRQAAGAVKPAEVKSGFRVCALCGDLFEYTHNAQKVCDTSHYRDCPVCGKDVLVRYPSSPVSCCSDSCTQVLRERTMERRLGVKHAAQNAEVRKKVRATNIRRFGVEHAAQNVEVRQKMVVTNMSRYGVSTPFQAVDFAEKAKATTLVRYGVEHTGQIADHQEKARRTCLLRYGVPHQMQCRDIHSKAYRSRRCIASDGTVLDSTYELQVYECFSALGCSITRNVPIEYDYEGSTHTTYIDFEVDGQLFEVKGAHLLNGCYDYAGVPISRKLEVYKDNHVVLITDAACRERFGKPNSAESNGLKYLHKCPRPLIGVDISLFGDPEFPYDDKKPRCYYDVRVGHQQSAYEAFHSFSIRWKMIKNRISYSGGFIDAKQVLTALNVSRTCKQPSWFSKSFASHIVKTYVTTDTVVDPFAGWGARADACRDLGISYIGCDVNSELVQWHQEQGRDIAWGDAKHFKYDSRCSVFICPPYQDVEIYVEDQDVSLTQCQWLSVVMQNVPNAVEYVMVCKIVDPGWEQYVVEVKQNKSHFGNNLEYVLKVPNY